jgi:hypothetical protein
VAVVFSDGADGKYAFGNGDGDVELNAAVGVENEYMLLVISPLNVLFELRFPNRLKRLEASASLNTMDGVIPLPRLNFFFGRRRRSIKAPNARRAAAPVIEPTATPATAPLLRPWSSGDVDVTFAVAVEQKPLMQWVDTHEEFIVHADPLINNAKQVLLATLQ